MTDKKSPLHGLPYIDRPESTQFERLNFYIQRNWKWTTVLGCIAATTLSIGAICAAYVLKGQVFSTVTLLGWLLMLLPLNYVPMLLVSFLEQTVAPPRAIRAALASATDEERAFIFAQLQLVIKSEWCSGPIDRGDLFALFKQARQNFGDHVIAKRARLTSARDMQIEELCAVAADEVEAVGSRESRS